MLFLAGEKVVVIEEPEYELAQTYPELELRRYPAYLFAETEVRGGLDEVGGQAFRIPAAHTLGNSRAREKMEMTAPVRQNPAAGVSEKLEMTAPVTQKGQGCGGNGYLCLELRPAPATR